MKPSSEMTQCAVVFKICLQNYGPRRDMKFTKSGMQIHGFACVNPNAYKAHHLLTTADKVNSHRASPPKGTTRHLTNLADVSCFAGSNEAIMGFV